MPEWALRPEVGNEGHETVSKYGARSSGTSGGTSPLRQVFTRIHASFFGHGSKLLVMRWSSCVCGLTVLAYPSWQLSNVVLAILGWAFGTTPCTAWWEGTG